MKTATCPKCKKTFCSLQSLQRHLQKKFPCKEKKNIEKKAEKNIIKVCEKSAKNIKINYICEYCNKEFNHKNNLYTHKTHLRCKKMPIREKKKRAIKLLNSNTKKISKSTENEILSLNLIQNNNNNIQINNNNSINDSFNNNTIIQNHITIFSFVLQVL